MKPAGWPQNVWKELNQPKKNNIDNNFFKFYVL